MFPFPLDTPVQVHYAFQRIWDRDPFALVELHLLATGRQAQVDPSYRDDLVELGFLQSDGTLSEMIADIAEVCIQEHRDGRWSFWPLPPTVVIFGDEPEVP